MSVQDSTSETIKHVVFVGIITDDQIKKNREVRWQYNVALDQL